MKRTSLLLCTIIAFTFIAGCGTVAAPPIDLPAPVTGRITSGGPDLSSKATFTGGAGAIPQEAIDVGVIVVAENTRITGNRTSLLWDITDSVFSPAYAQVTEDFPPLCSQSGYGCAIPGSDGSFTVQVDAYVDDIIDIYVANPDTGIRMGAIAQLTVPTGPTTDCTDSSAEGMLADMKNVGGVPFTLFEGLGAQSNQLIIGSDIFDLPGCYAKSLAVLATMPDDVFIAAISSSDKLLWLGHWNGTTLTIGKVINLTDIPEAVAIAGDPAYTHVAMRKTSGFTVEKIQNIDGNSASTLPIPEPISLTDIKVLRTFGPFADNNYIGGVIAVGPGGLGPEAYLTFFHAESLNPLTAFVDGIFLGSDMFLSIDPYEIVDMQFALDINQSDRALVLFIDRMYQALYATRLIINSTLAFIEPATTNAADLPEDLGLDYDPAFDLVSISNVMPRRFAVGVSGTTLTAYVITDENALFKIQDYTAGLSAITTETAVSGAGDLWAIDIDDIAESVLVGDRILNDVVDLSSLWGP
jgi:hypothetical protein